MWRTSPTFGQRVQRRRLRVAIQNGRLETLEMRNLLAVTFEAGTPIIAPDLTIPNSVAAGDFDRDGDIDIVVAANGNDRIGWFENLDGNGTFGTPRIIADDAISVTSIIAADIDGDGNIDIVSGGASAYDSDVSWYRNLGNGTFGAVQLISAEVQGTDAVFAADLDRDGDLDVLSASRGDNKLAWYENTDGKGTFGEQKLLTDAARGARAVAASDFDGDGDMDVVAGSYDDDSVWWFENLGEGTFSGELLLTDTADYVTDVIVADLDADGKPDILVASRDDHSVTWMQNLGNGEFTTEQVIALETFEPYGILVEDVDHDGLNDVLVADLLRDEVAWYRNLGNQQFDSPATIAADLNGAVSLVAADADSDGDLDIFTTSRFDNKVTFIRHNEQNSFSAPVVLNELGFQGSQFVSSGDVDGDGDDDILAASFTGDRLSWFENMDARGTFGPERIISNRTNGTEIALLADFDKDGDLDVASASFLDDKIAWYENLDGKGNFGPQRLVSGDNQGPEYLDVADVDGDGDIDIISSSRYDGKIAWYENLDGKGRFGPQVIVWLSANLTTFVRAVDMDGDGDLDIVANDYYPANSTISWYENVNGRGVFGGQNVISLEVELPAEADFADFDGDGDVDVVVVSSDDNRVLWFENANGDGDFADGRLLSDTMEIPYTVRAVDLDADGDPDVLVGDLGADTLVWFENEDSLGTFGAAQLIADNQAGIDSVAVADLDRDGDMDAIASLTTADSLVWFRNLRPEKLRAGDFNADSVVDLIDIDLLCAAIQTSDDDRTFDLSGDGNVNRNDLNDLIVNQLHTTYGDVNLDGVFNSADFVLVFQIGEYEDGVSSNSTWADGDWNCDGEFSSADLVLAFQAGGFTSA